MNIVKNAKTPFKILVASLLLLASSHSAFAVGTASDTIILNTASIDYEVGGVNQIDVTADVSFRVDARVDFTVTGTNNASVTPGSVDGLKYTIANDGNEMYDFALASSTIGIQDFSTAGFLIYLDDGTGNTWTGSAITKLSNLAADANQIVWLVGTIPGTAADTQTSTNHLIATAELAGGGGPLPSGTIADDPLTKQYVYADAQGSLTASDVARDAKHSASAIFTIESAVLLIVKSSTVIWDPVNLVSNPLRIPGAIVEYSILITNSGTAMATAIVVTDVLVASLVVPSTIPAPLTGYTDGNSVARTTPNLNGGAIEYLADTATVAGQTVTVSGIVLLGGESATVNILAQIQ